jgi:competence protein ComEC
VKYLFWIIIFSIFIVRFLATRPIFKEGQVLKISGNLLSEPNSSYGKLIFNLNGIRINLKTSEEIHYGDFIEIKGIYQKGELQKTSLLSVKTSTNVFTKIREKLVNFYKSNLREPNGSLVAGITIGAKSDLPYNLKQKLINSGTSHIVVASGTNITIFGSFVLSLLIKKLSRLKTLLLTITFIWIYTFICGLEAPIVRAVIMASIAFTGIILGRLTNTLRITFVVGLIMVIINPNWIEDVGFLLSFATTISLILFSNPINRLLKLFPEFIKEDLSTSLAAQIGSLPIILFFFGQFNPLSPLYNVLVLWTVPFIMAIGGISAILSFVYLPLAKLILNLSLPLTTYFVSIISL